MSQMSQSTLFRLNTEAAFNNTKVDKSESTVVTSNGVEVFEITLHSVYEEGTGPGLEKYQKKEVTIRNKANGSVLRIERREHSGLLEQILLSLRGFLLDPIVS